MGGVTAVRQQTRLTGERGLYSSTDVFQCSCAEGVAELVPSIFV